MMLHYFLKIYNKKMQTNLHKFTTVREVISIQIQFGWPFYFHEYLP